MYQLKKLENNLESVLKKFNINEVIDIKLTKSKSFDLQINNLVKFNNHPNISEIINEFEIELNDETFVNSRLGQFIHKKNKIQKINNSSYPDKKNRKKLIHNFIDNLKNKNYRHLVSTKDIIDSMSICFAAEKSLKLKKEIKIKYLTK